MEKFERVRSGEDDRVGDTNYQETSGRACPLPQCARGFGVPRSKQTPFYSRAAYFFHTLASGPSLVRRVRWPQLAALLRSEP